MEPTVGIALLISIIGSIIGIASFVRQGKQDSAGLEARLTALENKHQTMQDILNGFSVAEIAKMEAQLENLNTRVEKLDTDVEKKIDQLTVKVDSLMLKMNEILVKIANGNNPNQ
jgi:SMC interacting uncharacterized protein involved in chromosome segregation